MNRGNKEKGLEKGWCLEYRTCDTVGSVDGFSMGGEWRWVRIRLEGALEIRMKDMKGFQRMHPQCTFRLVHPYTNNFIMGDAV